MKKFVYYTPTYVLFGPGIEEKTGTEIVKRGGTKVLLHAGKGSARRSGLLDRIEKILRDAGLEVIVLEGVEANPKLSLVREGIRICREKNVDFILAVGGGSVIDSSKAIAVGAANPDLDIWEDFFIARKQPEKILPVACVLTIAAAGSEMSASMVVTKEEGRIKRGYSSNMIRPVFAVLDPELTYTLPAYQTGCGCADIMMHTLERFCTTTEGNHLTDKLAVSVLQTIVEYGPRAIAEPTDYEAQSEIMWAGSLSHNGITGLGNKEDWATHQLGHELTGKYDASHGATLTAMWGSWARTVYTEKPERFAALGLLVFGFTPSGDMEADALAAIDRMEEAFRSLKMPTSIPELLGRTLDDGELDELAYKCSFQGTRTIGGFRVLTQEDMRKIYAKANH